MTRGQSRSSSPQNRQDQASPSTTDANSQKSQPPDAVEYQGSGTIGTSIVGPIKSYVTKAINNARNQYRTSTEAIRYFVELEKQTPPETRALEDGDQLLLEAKKAAHKLRSVDIFVDLKFSHPMMQASPDKAVHWRDIQDAILKADVKGMLQRLDMNIHRLESILSDFDVIPTEFNPEPFEEKAPPVTGTRDLPTDQQPLEPSSQMQQGTDTKSTLSTENKNESTDPKSPANAIPTSSELTTDKERLAIEEVERLKRTIEIMKEKETSAFLNQKALQQEREMAKLDAENAKLSEQQIRKQLQKQLTEADMIAGQNIASTTAPIITAPPSTESASVSVSQLIPPTSSMSQVNVHPAANINQLVLEQLVQCTLQQASATSDTNRIMTQLPALLENTVSRMQQSVTEAIRERLPDDNASDDHYAEDYERAFDTEQEPVPSPRRAPPQYHAPAPTRPSYESEERNPRLETLLKILRPYDGTTDLATFEHQFKTSIMINSTLSIDYKFILLQNFLKDKASSCIMRSDSAAKSINLTFNALHEVFGSDYSRRNQLEKLSKCTFNQQDPKEMKLDLVIMKSILLRLKEQGVSEDDENIHTMIASKLPDDMRRNAVQLIAALGGGRMTIQSLIDQISLQINITETDSILSSQKHRAAMNEIPNSYAAINYANTKQSSRNPATTAKTPVYKPESYKDKYVDPLTKEHLDGIYRPGPNGLNKTLIHNTFPFTRDEPFFCPACAGRHHGIRCPAPSAEFRNRLTQQNKCHICASGKHKITECTSSFRCGYCDGLHHMGGCPLKEFYRDTKNYPTDNDVKPIVKFFRDRAQPRSQ